MMERDESELQFEVARKKEELIRTAPNDTFFLVHILFFMLGLLHFMPYNYFTCAFNYWMYKFRDTEDEDWTPTHPKNILQSEFAASTQICSAIPSVLFLTLTTIYGNMVKVQIRMYGSLATLLVMFIMFTILIEVNTDSWQVGFFVLTMFSIVLITIANSVMGITLFLFIAKFPNIYLKSYLLGNAVAGLCNSLLEVLALSIGTTVHESALIYFLTGTSFVAVSILFYVVGQQLEYFKHFVGNIADEKVAKRPVHFNEMKEILKETWAANTVFVLVTLTGMVNPAVTALVVSEDESDSEWATEYFVPVCTFLMFDIGDLLGRSFSYIKIKYNNIVVVIINVIRFFVVFVLIMLCRTEPRKHLPIVFKHDYQYIIIMLIYATTAGYFFNFAYIMVQDTLTASKVQLGYSVLTTGYGIVSAVFSIVAWFLVYML